MANIYVDVVVAAGPGGERVDELRGDLRHLHPGPGHRPQARTPLQVGQIQNTLGLWYGKVNSYSASNTCTVRQSLLKHFTLN